MITQVKLHFGILFNFDVASHPLIDSQSFLLQIKVQWNRKWLLKLIDHLPDVDFSQYALCLNHNPNDFVQSSPKILVKVLDWWHFEDEITLFVGPFALWVRALAVSNLLKLLH